MRTLPRTVLAILGWWAFGLAARAETPARRHEHRPRPTAAKPAELSELPRMPVLPEHDNAVPAATSGQRFTVGPVTVTPGGFLAGENEQR